MCFTYLTYIHTKFTFIQKSKSTDATLGSLEVGAVTTSGPLHVKDGGILVESGGLAVSEGITVATGDLTLAGATSTISAAGK